MINGEWWLDESGNSTFADSIITIEQNSDHDTWDVPMKVICNPNANIDAVKRLSGIERFRSRI